jgi:hypothetical protein
MTQLLATFILDSGSQLAWIKSGNKAMEGTALSVTGTRQL